MSKKRFLLFTIFLIILSLAITGCSNNPGTSTDNTYSISGKIQNLAGEGIEDVKITVEGSSKSTTTNSEGKWTLSNLSGTNKITAAKEYYAFKPNSKTVTGKESINIKGQKRKVIFTSGKENNVEGNDIFSINIDGTDLTEYYAPDEHIWGGVPSPDGSKLAFIKPTNETEPFDDDIFIYDFETEPKNITNIPEEDHANRPPDWSSNSEELVYTKDGQYIIKADSDGNNKEALNSYDDSVYYGNPIFNPEGDKIIYYFLDTENNNYSGDIFIMNTDGSSKNNLTNTPEIDEFAHSLFPEEEKIVFTRLESGKGIETAELYKATIENNELKNLERLTNNNKFEYQTEIGPKGNYIIYTQMEIVDDSPDLTTSKIYIMDKDGNNKRLLYNASGQNDWWPHWLPLNWD